MTNIKKNILLVGGAGYIGSHLAEVLTSGYTVFSTSRAQQQGKIQFDFLDPATYQNINQEKKYDQIIILASTLQGMGTTELKKEYLEGNTIGLSQFLHYLSTNRLSDKIIYISSMAVYGREMVQPVKENIVLSPISTYGLGKKLAEEIVDFYCKSSNCKAAILRIPGVYGGKRKSGFVYTTSLKCAKNEPIEINTSTLGFWETIHIHDLCNWIAEFINKYDWKETSEVFNLSYGVPSDIVDCANKIKECLKSTSEIKHIGKEGYQEFYLDTTKIKKYVTIKENFYPSLKHYVLNLTI